MSAAGQNSVQSRSLWIGDIENWMDESFIEKSFLDYDVSVKKIKIIRDKAKGTSLGYGFVEFESADIANKVLSELNGRKMQNTNRTFKLNWASYSAGKTSSSGSNSEFSIYVGDLDTTVTDDSLKNFFSQFYSTVISAKIIIDPVTKTSKGYGFVKFLDHSESQKALVEMNGQLLNGKAIKTNQASFKKWNIDWNSSSTSTQNTQSTYYSNGYQYSYSTPYVYPQEMVNYNNTTTSTTTTATSASPTTVNNINSFYPTTDYLNVTNPQTIGYTNQTTVPTYTNCYSQQDWNNFYMNNGAYFGFANPWGNINPYYYSMYPNYNPYGDSSTSTITNLTNLNNNTMNNQNSQNSK